MYITTISVYQFIFLKAILCYRLLMATILSSASGPLKRVEDLGEHSHSRHLSVRLPLLSHYLKIMKERFAKKDLNVERYFIKLLKMS